MMTMQQKFSKLDKGSLFLALVLIAGVACATGLGGGKGGTEFQQVFDTLSGWASGTVGKIIAVAALLVGLGIGVVRQSIMAAVVGIAMALISGYGPNVIESVIDAGVPVTVAIDAPSPSASS